MPGCVGYWPRWRARFRDAARRGGSTKARGWRRYFGAPRRFCASSIHPSTMRKGERARRTSSRRCGKPWCDRRVTSPVCQAWEISVFRMSGIGQTDAARGGFGCVGRLTMVADANTQIGVSDILGYLEVVEHFSMAGKTSSSPSVARRTLASARAGANGTLRICAGRIVRELREDRSDRAKDAIHGHRLCLQSVFAVDRDAVRGPAVTFLPSQDGNAHRTAEHLAETPRGHCGQRKWQGCKLRFVRALCGAKPVGGPMGPVYCAARGTRAEADFCARSIAQNTASGVAGLPSSVISPVPKAATAARSASRALSASIKGGSPTALLP